MGKPRPYLLFFIFLFCGHCCFSQYILNGSAQKVSCNCYTLTQETTHQSGSVWNSRKIDLRQSFDFWFKVNLGCRDAAGADGIVFILQPISTSVGSTGEGMGFSGITPSIGIALDTYQNTNQSDPAYDHISIQANGNIHHANDLAGPVPVSASSSNVEDCQWHRLRISWDAGAKRLRAYFDGVLRVEKQVDLVTAIFNNDPMVYWGFTGATGGAFNLQQFCTALDPIFTTSAGSNVACEGSPVTFTNASESFAPIVSYAWSFGDGTTSTQQNPAPHTYASPGTYTVHLKIKGQDGCEADSAQTITVGSIPQAQVSMYDTCYPYPPRVQFPNQNVGVQYDWYRNGMPVASGQQPLFPSWPAGTHTVQLVVSSLYGCGSPDTAAATFNLYAQPVVEARVNDGCAHEDIVFAGVQVDSLAGIAQWRWSFGDGAGAAGQHARHRFSQPGRYAARLWTVSTDGCLSDTVTRTVQINAAYAFAGPDTSIVQNTPYQFPASGNGSFSWSPASGLSDPFIKDPVAVLHADQHYRLTVQTPEGCVAIDTVLIRVFRGPTVYVASAFTPNGDGRNDVLRPAYVGIKELKQFVVYNRWGQTVFSTKSMKSGWDGSAALSGTYVWLVQAVDHTNKPIVLKGTVTIIR